MKNADLIYAEMKQGPKEDDSFSLDQFCKTNLLHNSKENKRI